MFTLKNTEGFTQEILDKMNAELETALVVAELDEEDADHKSQVDFISNKIFNKYC